MNVYDFNVIYCRGSPEGESVAETVTVLLEKNNLKGYYADRDLMPGQDIVNEYCRVLRKSNYTILVIDKEFVKQPRPVYLSPWAMWHLAVSGYSTTTIKRLVVIYVGVTEDYVAREFPRVNIKQTVYFPSATLRECDKKVLAQLALALRGCMDISDALAIRSEQTGEEHESFRTYINIL
jgi:hypothetical protein